jgi:hypothetical protein
VIRKKCNAVALIWVFATATGHNNLIHYIHLNFAKHNMTSEEFKQALENSYKSTPIKSTRRILFNHLYQTVEERGHFHVDQMFGAGTCILFKQDAAFYLLTARHVIENATKFQFNNDSPFWVSCSERNFGNDLHDFLMPGQILHVGELIADRGKNIDASDLILVEMFYPNAGRMPDQFIDLDTRPDALMRKDEFFAGQILLAAGFPFEHNSFDFHEETAEGFTHSTNISRHIFDGFCDFDDIEPFISAENLGTYPNLSGASGGVVTNVQPTSHEVKMAGMLVTAGPTIARFIPSYLISEAISNKHKARKQLVDPAFIGQPPEGLRAIFDELARNDKSD